MTICGLTISFSDAKDSIGGGISISCGIIGSSSAAPETDAIVAVVPAVDSPVGAFRTVIDLEDFSRSELGLPTIGVTRLLLNRSCKEQQSFEEFKWIGVELKTSCGSQIIFKPTQPT